MSINDYLLTISDMKGPMTDIVKNEQMVRVGEITNYRTQGWGHESYGRVPA
jgi:hypothetical protein